MNLEKFLRTSEGGLEINDMNGEISSLTEDFFANYSDIKWLSIYGTELIELPSSFNKLTQLLALKLYKTKFKYLPEINFILKRIKKPFTLLKFI